MANTCLLTVACNLGSSVIEDAL